MQDCLIDTSFLVALSFPQDRNHLTSIESIFQQTGKLIVASPVIVEFVFIARKIAGYHKAIHELQRILSSNIQIVELNREDYFRAVEIMHQYIDAKIDIADAAQVAIAERLQITRICTFDRRDFSLFRPVHCEYLELIP